MSSFWHPSESEVTIAAGTFMSAKWDTSYKYKASDDCNLDEANGNHPVRE